MAAPRAKSDSVPYKFASKQSSPARGFTTKSSFSTFTPICVRSMPGKPGRLSCISVRLCRVPVIRAGWSPALRLQPRSLDSAAGETVFSASWRRARCRQHAEHHGAIAFDAFYGLAVYNNTASRAGAQHHSQRGVTTPFHHSPTVAAAPSVSAAIGRPGCFSNSARRFAPMRKSRVYAQQVSLSGHWWKPRYRPLGPAGPSTSLPARQNSA